MCYTSIKIGKDGFLHSSGGNELSGGYTKYTVCVFWVFFFWGGGGVGGLIQKLGLLRGGFTELLWCVSFVVNLPVN